MSQNTGIEWTDHTFSPWWGCTKVSPACDHCYAETWSKRTGFKIWGQDAGRRFLSNKHWHEPFKWNDAAERDGVRRKVFCGSMCDIMEDRRDLDVLRGDLWQVIKSTPWLDWQLLTKRPQNYRRFLPPDWVNAGAMPANVWCGTTVESAEYLWRVDALKGCGASVLFLSVEPLLGPMPTLGEYLDGIAWVIVGGESGHHARPMHPEWARSVGFQCEDHGVALFFKQWGEWVPSERGGGSHLIKGHGVKPHSVCPERVLWLYPDGSSDPLGMGDAGRGTTMIRVGKANADRLLDGREWNEFPKSAMEIHAA